MTIELAYEILITSALIILALSIMTAIIKSIIGPRLTDRIVSVNMVGTCVVACIVLLTIYYRII